MIHIMALDQALKHGLILDKVCQAVKFGQSTWLASYIEFNTQLRTRAKNNCEKDFFKFMNNSVFGKTMENIRKHRNINLVMNKEAYLVRVMKLNFKLEIIFSENLMGCEMGKIRAVMNKPVYLGQAILSLNEIVMNNFHHKYMKPKWLKSSVELNGL